MRPLRPTRRGALLTGAAALAAAGLPRLSVAAPARPAPRIASPAQGETVAAR